MAAVAQRLFWRRNLTNKLALLLSGAAALIGLAFLVWICWTTLSKGVTALSPTLFTQMTPPPGEEGGGLLNAIAGSMMICVLAVLIATPIGIAAGTFLAEYAKLRWMAESIRFLNDILLSAPSIVMGLFVYTIVLNFVKPQEQFSGLSGAVALALIVLPVIVRTTDEMLRLVPAQMREAALSLGIPQWKVTTQVLYRAAMSGILTGILLGLARISGETAPLLFTAFNNQYWNANLAKPMANLPVTVYQFAMSPFDRWNQLAWAGAFLITLFVLLTSLLARFLLLRNKISHD
jgi:phosphate transport system permease protein